MPLFFQHTVNASAKLGVWHIAEAESFFFEKVPLQKNITHWHKRLQHLAGRYLLQELYPDFPYHLIEIAPDSYRDRKPYLPDEEYHFSISHCGDYAAVMISKNKRVGIDIELVTDKVDKIKHKFLNEEELRAIDNKQWEMSNGKSINQSTTQLINQLTLLWCCKEAVFKWFGNGGVDFRRDIKLVSIDIADKIINCEFLKGHKVLLPVNYFFFDDMCLAWIIQ